VKNTDLWVVTSGSLVHIHEVTRRHNPHISAIMKSSIVDFHENRLTHWHTQTPVRRSEPSMTFLLILAFCQ